jgi:hypothetical protein
VRTLITVHPALFVLAFAVLLTPAFALAEDDALSPPGEASVIPMPPVVPSAPAVPANLILNGDFEITSIAAGCHFNLSNAHVTAGMANITAFGDADEIDLLNGGTSCGYAGPPYSGDSKLAIHRQEASGGAVDAFGFELSETIIGGQAYAIVFYAWANRDWDPDIGQVEIGLSTVPNEFGTPVFFGVPSDTQWALCAGTFVAPAGASYLTVRVMDGYEAWIHIDNFSLEYAGTPVVESSWGRLKTMYR